MEKQFKIMIVEDEENVAMAIKAIVSKHFKCKEIITAKDGQEAWDILRANDYDLILSDWNMPNKTGDELLLDVRENDKTRNIPFIMLTVRADKGSVFTALQGGTTYYLTKPFEKRVLIEKIQKLLGYPTSDSDRAKDMSVKKPVIKEKPDKGNCC